jgi:hypothetical protein
VIPLYPFESLTAEEQAAARRVERIIQSGATPLGLPLLNPAHLADEDDSEVTGAVA